MTRTPPAPSTPDPVDGTDPGRAAGVGRRAVVGGGAGLLAGGLLTACGGATATAPGTPAAPPAPAGPSSPAGPAGVVLAPTSAIPVGGGTVFADRDVVVTQPTSGEFKAFSATCTHQGCAVTTVTDGQIVCPCHNSRFAVADGSVTAGPARRPLPEKPIAVEGGSVVLT